MNPARKRSLKNSAALARADFQVEDGVVGTSCRDGNGLPHTFGNVSLAVRPVAAPNHSFRGSERGFRRRSNGVTYVGLTA